MIYLDHAATSWPKAPGVAEAVAQALISPVGNVGRSAHPMALAAARILYDCRLALQEIVHTSAPEKTVFTRNATEALNIAILGSLAPEGRVLTTAVEHNAVARPLHHLMSNGVHVDTCACDVYGIADAADFDRRLGTGSYDLVVFTAANNLTGAVNPIRSLVESCIRHHVPFVIDAAQAMGEMDIPRFGEGAQGALCFSLHKGLLGPSGVGVMGLYGDFSPRPLIYGGTGSRSDSVEQPDFLPDRYESGTSAIAVIAGAKAALDHMAIHGQAINHERKRLADILWDDLSRIGQLRMLGPREGRSPIVSVTVHEGSIDRLAQALFAKQVAVRSGFHCAPLAHRHLGTEVHGGAIRFSVGHTNTEAELQMVSDTIREVCDGR